jgi:hypothetical protein
MNGGAGKAAGFVVVEKVSEELAVGLKSVPAGCESAFFVA